MSRLNSITHAIKARLEEIPDLAGKVVIFHRKSIKSEFESRMQKAKGMAVIVRLLDADNTSREKVRPRFAGNFTVAVFRAPGLTLKDAEESDALIQSIADQLHGWWPESIPSNGLIWVDVTGITFPEDPDYEIAVLNIEAPRKTS